MQNALFRKGVVFGIIVLFIGASTVSAINGNQSTRPKPIDRGWLYVGGSGPGNYTTIQSAINAASSGDTVFVYHGSYNEKEIVIDKQITLIGENKTNTTLYGSGSYWHILWVKASSVKITGFYIQNRLTGWYGIYLDHIQYCNITGNSIYNLGWYGIGLSGSNNNRISGNDITGSGWYCIDNDGSNNNNIIYNNYFSKSPDGWGNNKWNISKTIGTNIMGGPFMGGNYWTSYSGPDTDGDGLGDTPYGQDFLPLKTTWDHDPPTITNITINPNLQKVGGYVNISCNVIDWGGADEVHVNLTYPNNTTDNLSMNLSYFLNQTYSQIGTYQFFIWANDIYNYSNISTIYSFIIDNFPNLPFNPSPLNGTMDVDINSDLSWNCSDPDSDNLSYDVYFGTSSNPPLVSTGQSSTSYNPGTMDFGTIYYWKIVAIDEYGAYTDGPIWSFTTRINNPPYTPNDPNPANGTTNVNVIINLSWNGGDPDVGDTVTYDIYFGISLPPPIVVYGQNTTTYNPGKMLFNITYYWKIVAWDNYGSSTVGPLWNYTTRSENPPYEPSNPSPANSSTFVDINTMLNWKGGDPDNDAVTYDVYFGTSSPPPLVNTNQTETTYNPGSMDYETPYYWRIVAWDNYGASTLGPIWNFETEPELHSLFLLGLISNLSDIGDYFSFKARLLFIYDIDLGIPRFLQSGEHLVVSKENQIGYIGPKFIIGIFDGTILADFQIKNIHLLENLLLNHFFSNPKFG